MFKLVMLVTTLTLILGCPTSDPQPPVSVPTEDIKEPKEPEEPKDYCTLKEAEECWGWIFNYEVNPDGQTCITHWQSENILNTCETLEWCETFVEKHKIPHADCYPCRKIDPYASAVISFTEGKDCP